MNTYIKHFLNTKASSQVLPLFNKGKNVCKELTESWGCLEAAKKYCKDLSDCIVYVIGDGSTPRTAALFAFYTGAQCFSVDPALNLPFYNMWVEKERPQRLSIMKKKIEEIGPQECNNKRLLVIWPHSHAPMKESLGLFINYESRTDIILPCCVQIPHSFMKYPHIIYADNYILSPKNYMHIIQENL